MATNRTVAGPTPAAQGLTILAIWLAAAGCGGGHGGAEDTADGGFAGDSGGGDGAGDSPQCTRTAALHDARACRVDDDCACGAHCTLGACTFECEADADCATGQVCDDFGRCAQPGLPRVRRRETGAAQVEVEAQAEIAAPNTPFHVRLTPRGEGRVRVVASPGTLLWCTPGAEPSDACTFDTLPDAGLALGIGLDAQAFAAGDDARAEVFDASGERTVIGAARLAPAAAPTVTTLSGMAGHYVGTARLGDVSGLTGSVENARSSEAALQADLHVLDGSHGVLALRDVRGTVLPHDVVLSLDGAEDGATLRFPALRWLSGLATDTTSLQLPLSHVIDVTFALPLASAGAEALSVHITLTRSGDVAGEAGSVVDDDLGVAPGPLPVGQALYDAFAKPSPQVRLDTSTLAGCANLERGVSERPLALRQLCDDVWEPEYLMLNGNTQENALPLDENECTKMRDDGSIDILCNVYTRGTDMRYFEGYILDVCDDMVQRSGCEPIGWGDPRLGFVAGVDGAVDSRGYFVWAASPSFMGDPARACRVPPLSADAGSCTAAVLCTDGVEDADTPQALDHVSTVTGDALCRDGAESTVAPGLESMPSDLAAFLDGCALDLREAGDAEARAPADILRDRACLNGPRLYATVDRALAATRTGGDARPLDQALAHRLLQQLLLVQEMEARLAGDVYVEAAALAQALPTGDTLERLAASAAPWNVLLDARIVAPLFALSPALLNAPDPRPGLGLSLDATTPPGPTEGLSIALLDAVAAPIETLSLLLEQAYREGNAAGVTDLRARYGEFARRAQLVAVLADALYARASSAGPVSWQAGYSAARARHASALAQFDARLSDIDAGKSPLGIDDADLPLVFPGEPTNDRDRFLAVSRFLIGTGPGDRTAIVPRAVAEATSALDAARSQWRERTDLELDGDRRIEDITRRYGELITGYCGAPIDDPTFDVDSYNVLDRPLDTEVCFVEPACRVRPDGFRETITAASLARELCVLAGARDLYPAATEVDPALRTVLDVVKGHLRAPGASAWSVLLRGFSQPSPNTRLVQATIGGVDVEVPVSAVGALPARLPAALLSAPSLAAFEPGRNPATPLFQAEKILAECGARAAATEALRPQGRPSVCANADQCPVGDRCVEGRCTPPGPDPLDGVECYFDGAISEQALAVRSLAVEAEVAKGELEEFATRYDIAKQSCIILKAGQNEVDRLTNAHNALMNNLDIGRTAALHLASAAGALESCASLDTALSVGASCAGSLGKAAAEIAANTLELTMNILQRDHEDALREVQDHTELARCFNDASMELVGARSAALRIKQAAQAQAQAVINLRGQKSYTAALWVEGNIAVENERRRLARSLPTRTVLSEAAELFRVRFRYAQRLTYLAVRAVEHELQASLSQARHDTLGATRPDQLEDVLRRLAASVNDGTIGGSQPVGLQVVVSLRDHLLQLRDRRDNPAGELNLSAVERFRLLLVDPRYATYDDAGRYQGQRIPFSLHPLGALGLGMAQGIPVFAQNSCAERIFAVNAALVGEDVLAGGSSVTRLDLLQRNTFYSQRCEGGFDVASVRPAVNLLADHAEATQQNPSPAAFDTFARGQMQPYVNVARADFEREEYAQGSTIQLAGRGLYADYALFIPAGIIAQGEGDGLRLDRVDDILLRIDYVSAAR